MRTALIPSCHPERPHFGKGLCNPCYHHDYYEQRKDKWRSRQSGYVLGQFDRMVAEQGGRCALCDDKVPLVADHDHETGKPRRPLCQVCNKAIGMLHDDPDLVSRAAQYLASFRPSAVGIA
jgi:Recombination endonuclease VII